MHDRALYHTTSGRLAVEYYYAASGAPTENVVPNHVSHVYKYDDYGRVIQVEFVLTGGATRIEYTTYDELGRKATSASPKGSILYEFDVLGRMNLKSKRCHRLSLIKALEGVKSRTIFVLIWQ